MTKHIIDKDPDDDNGAAFFVADVELSRMFDDLASDEPDNADLPDVMYEIPEGIPGEDSETPAADSSQRKKRKANDTIHRDSLHMYGTDIGKFKLLSPEGEVRAFRRLEYKKRKMLQAISLLPFTMEGVTKDDAIDGAEGFEGILALAAKVEKGTLPFDDVFDIWPEGKPKGVTQEDEATQISARKREIAQQLLLYKKASDELKILYSQTIAVPIDGQENDGDQIKRQRHTFKVMRGMMKCSRLVRPLISGLQMQENMKLTDHVIDHVRAHVEKEGVNADPFFKKERDRYDEGATGYRSYASDIAEANLRFVFMMSNRFERRGLERMDLIQEGNIALLKAIDKFKYARGNKFSTYLSLWVDGAMKSGIYDMGRTIRLPQATHKNIRELMKARKTLAEEWGREPESLEISRHMRIDVKEVQRLLEISRDTISLETPVGNPQEEEESALTLGNFVVEESLSPEEAVYRKERAGEIAQLMREIFISLTKKEKIVIIARLGLLGSSEYSLEDVGKIILPRMIAGQKPLTRERVRQIEAKALATLKSPETIELLKELREFFSFKNQGPELSL